MKQKTIKIIYWITTVLFGLAMFGDGVFALIGNEMAQEGTIALGYPVYLLTILGIAKILGVIGIFQKNTTLREWAYAGFTINLVGASASHLLNSDPILFAFGPLIFLAVMFISYFTWKKLK